MEYKECIAYPCSPPPARSAVGPSPRIRWITYTGPYPLPEDTSARDRDRERRERSGELGEERLRKRLYDGVARHLLSVPAEAGPSRFPGAYVSPVAPTHATGAPTTISPTITAPATVALTTTPPATAPAATTPSATTPPALQFPVLQTTPASAPSDMSVSHGQTESRIRTLSGGDLFPNTLSAPSDSKSPLLIPPAATSPASTAVTLSSWGPEPTTSDTTSNAATSGYTSANTSACDDDSASSHTSSGYPSDVSSSAWTSCDAVFGEDVAAAASIRERTCRTPATTVVSTLAPCPPLRHPNTPTASMLTPKILTRTPLPRPTTSTANPKASPPTRTSTPTSPARPSWADATGARAASLGLWTVAQLVSGGMGPHGMPGGNVRGGGVDAGAMDGLEGGGAGGSEDNEMGSPPTHHAETSARARADSKRPAPAPASCEIIDLCESSDDEDTDAGACDVGEIDDGPGRAAARNLGRDACETILDHRMASSIYRLLRGATVPDDGGGRHRRVAGYNDVAALFRLPAHAAPDIAAFDAWAREYLCRGYSTDMVLHHAFGV